jgi:hypothetical protein
MVIMVACQAAQHSCEAAGRLDEAAAAGESPGPAAYEYGLWAWTAALLLLRRCAAPCADAQKPSILHCLFLTPKKPIVFVYEYNYKIDYL